MNLNRIWFNKKILVLFISLTTLFLSGIISSIYIEKSKSVWGDKLEERIEYTESVIINVLDKKIFSLSQASQTIKNNIRPYLAKNDRRGLFALFDSGNIDNHSIQIYDSKYDLIGWNSEPIIISSDISSIIEKESRVFFWRNKLCTYLTTIDTLNTSGNKFYLSVGMIIEKHYKLANSEFEHISIIDSLSNILSTAISIEFDPTAQLSKDGRQHSFFLTNNFGNKIGVATFEKPALDNELETITDVTKTIQSLLVLLIYFVIGYIGIDYYKSVRKKYIKFIIAGFYLALLRVLLFIFGVPSNFLRSSLTDSTNFSSVFAFGVVRSPLEFTITILFILGIVLLGFKLSMEYFASFNTGKNNWWKLTFVGLFSIILILLMYRGLGASIRSVIFDSTLRYFKEFSLIPVPPILLMDFNILVLGFCVFISSIILLNLIFYSYPGISKKNSKIFFINLFILLQLLGWIFDEIQKQPQGTPLIRIIYIALIYLSAIFAFVKDYKRYINLFYFGFFTSISTVSLLTYYNSEIERESLKTIAQELTRNDPSIYEFMIYQTLTQIKNDEEIINSFQKDSCYSTDAFILWTKGLLYRENLPSTINIYNNAKKFLGGFSNSSKSFSSVSLESIKFNSDRIIINKQTNPFTSETTISGFLIIKNNKSTIGYVEISSLINNNFYRPDNLPKFLVASKAGISSALDYEKLKIFFFSDGELINSFGGAALSKKEMEELVNAPNTSFNEAWLRMDLNNDGHLFYILKDTNKKSKLIAVSLEEKKFSWNLSNFFKVFFVHTIIILGIFLLFSLWYFPKWKNIIGSYRTRLAIAFVILSLIPLFIAAVYFRNITEGKNKELVNNRLTEFAQQIELCVKNYANNSSINIETIFSKAAQDLNISFTVFDRNKIIYSTDYQLYDVGLLPLIIPPKIYHDCILAGSEKIYLEEVIEKSDYNSIYLKSSINNEVLLIQVNNLFNKLSLPISDVELDLFLFGIFSLAVVLLVIFSTILAEQISSPVRKLTLAARSVGSGDLNVEVTGNYKGDIKELTDGFNNMVKKLGKSQLQMVQLERENAWKEMAKQVAHEIKNPLTPMKLAVQQLVTAYKDKSRKFDLIFEKVTSTIITQIEALRNIASEFSNFARMPRLNIERVNIVNVVQETLNLFSDEKLIIKFLSDLETVFVNADQDHLSRTIINLVRNSIQANSNIIIVDLTVNNRNAEIRISDDGIGIPIENIEKIFEENFTTKPQGMGLGLSMAKRFIESINGRIIIEKTSNIGTTFLITFPLAE